MYIKYIFFSFQFVGFRQKIIIIHLYKSKIVEQPEPKTKEIANTISSKTNVGKCTVQPTIYDYKNAGIAKSLNMKKKQLTIIGKTDDFEREAIRQNVHSF